MTEHERLAASRLQSYELSMKSGHVRCFLTQKKTLGEAPKVGAEGESLYLGKGL